MQQHVRVSEILAMFKDFSKIHPLVLKEKCEVGTETHDNIYKHNNEGEIEFKMFPIRKPDGELVLDSLGEEICKQRGKGYFESYLKWHKKNNHEWGPLFPIMEKRFYDNDLMITGQIDAIMDPHPFAKRLVDFKCSAQADVEIWSMQAHFYFHLLRIHEIHVDKKFHWIKLDKYGYEPEVIKINYDQDIMNKCFDAVYKYWEMKYDAKAM